MKTHQSDSNRNQEPRSEQAEALPAISTQASSGTRASARVVGRRGLNTEESASASAKFPLKENEAASCGELSRLVSTARKLTSSSRRGHKRHGYPPIRQTNWGRGHGHARQHEDRRERTGYKRRAGERFLFTVRGRRAHALAIRMSRSSSLR